MKSIKTAISIDPITFRRVERLAKRLHISRSRFFTQAAQYMIERDENLELLQKINAAYDVAETKEETLQSTAARSYTRKRTRKSW